LNILVTGGAGYIGSHACKFMAERGFQPIVIDNLINGHREAVKWGPLYEGDICDRRLLSHIFSKYQISCVMHFSAFCYVGESVSNPAKYYSNNVLKTIFLLEMMIKNSISRFIFSSSCTTYGKPSEVPIKENHPQKPINPYGWSKFMVECILENFRTAYDFEYISLRYFNAAGADPDGLLGEDHRPETHLIPLVLQTALCKHNTVKIFGTDYPTSDGTCIRDYIHVNDLAQAHILALERLINNLGGGTFNLGNGNGYSVREVIDTAARITGRKIPLQLTERRIGDPAILIGSSDKAVRELAWNPRYNDLDTIIETAWNWHKNYPNGYST
jgi:UDP-glucose-4-epimerase GalE